MEELMKCISCGGDIVETSSGELKCQFCNKENSTITKENECSKRDNMLFSDKYIENMLANYTKEIAINCDDKYNQIELGTTDNLVDKNAIATEVDKSIKVFDKKFVAYKKRTAKYNKIFAANANTISINTISRKTAATEKTLSRNNNIVVLSLACIIGIACFAFISALITLSLVAAGTFGFDSEHAFGDSMNTFALIFGIGGSIVLIIIFIALKSCKGWRKDEKKCKSLARKSLFTVITSVALISSLISIGAISAVKLGKSDDVRYKYTVTNEGVVIDGVYEVYIRDIVRNGHNNDTQIKLIIPDEINGKPVVEIGEYAFANNSMLQSIKLGKNVKFIQKNAFNNMQELSTFESNESLQSIGNEAFSNCGKLNTVILNEGLTIIGENAFQNCNYLSKVNIPNSIERISDRAFEGSILEGDLMLGDKIKYIGSKAFNLHPNANIDILYIESVQIEYVGFLAFSGNFKNVILASTYDETQKWVKNWDIGLEVISYGKTNLKFLKNGLVITAVNNEVEIISGRGYAKDILILEEEVEDYGTVTKIDDNAFKQNSLLEIVILPNSIKSIGKSAFENCYQISFFNIPKSAVIGKNAFKGLPSNSIGYAYKDKDDYKDGESSENWVSHVSTIMWKQEFDEIKLIDTTVVGFKPQSASILKQLLYPDSVWIVPESFNNKPVTTIMPYVFSKNYDSLVNSYIYLSKSVKEVYSCAFLYNDIKFVYAAKASLQKNSINFDTLVYMDYANDDHCKDDWRNTNNTIMAETVFSTPITGIRLFRDILYGYLTNTTAIAIHTDAVSTLHISSKIIERDVTEIGSGFMRRSAYNYDPYESSIKIPRSVKIIRKNAFGIERDTSEYANIFIPKEVTTIESCAFLSFKYSNFFIEKEADTSKWGKDWHYDSYENIYNYEIEFSY